MEASANTNSANYVGGARVPTQAIKVMVTTDDYEIEGFLHIKPGGYQSRVSDVLNAKGLHYVPITHASFRSLRHPDTPVRQADTLIVKLDTIKMVVPENGQDHQIPDLHKHMSEPGESFTKVG